MLPPPCCTVPETEESGEIHALQEEKIQKKSDLCQQDSAYFKGISLESVSFGFGNIIPGCFPSNLLQSERENCGWRIKKFRWNNFTNGWKFVKFTKIKHPRNFSAIRYAIHLSCPIDSLPEKVFYHTLTRMHTCTPIRFVAMMSTAALFLAFSFMLRIVSGIGIAMFSTASYTLLTQFFTTKKGSIVVSFQ